MQWRVRAEVSTQGGACDTVCKLVCITTCLLTSIISADLSCGDTDGPVLGLVHTLIDGMCGMTGRAPRCKMWLVSTCKHSSAACCIIKQSACAYTDHMSSRAIMLFVQQLYRLGHFRNGNRQRGGSWHREEESALSVKAGVANLVPGQLYHWRQQLHGTAQCLSRCICWPQCFE